MQTPCSSRAAPHRLHDSGLTVVLGPSHSVPLGSAPEPARKGEGGVHFDGRLAGWPAPGGLSGTLALSSHPCPQRGPGIRPADDYTIPWMRRPRLPAAGQLDSGLSSPSGIRGGGPTFTYTDRVQGPTPEAPQLQLPTPLQNKTSNSSQTETCPPWHSGLRMLGPGGTRCRPVSWERPWAPGLSSWFHQHQPPGAHQDRPPCRS